MECFEYPLDTKTLLRKKKSIKRKLLERNTHWLRKHIAVLGGSTTSEIVEQLDIFLLQYGIKGAFYQSGFGTYWEEAVFDNPKLDDFQPDIIYIHTNWRNIKNFPAMTSGADETDKALETEFERLRTMWVSVQKKYNCIVIQNNFDRTNYRILGNRDVWDFRGRSNFISRLNQKLYNYAQKNRSFYVNDIDRISAEYGLQRWNDSFYWSMYKYACPLDAIPYLAQNVAIIIKSIYGKNKKLLALDMDNTLWGGIIGDDGIEGIELGEDTPSGQEYLEFQRYIKGLQSIGVILAIVSKNDEEKALEGLSHPDGVLKDSDFISIKANWEPKDQNLMTIADELSLGVDSFVFVDDNPVERGLVQAQLPMVEVPEIGSPGDYIKVLEHSGYFEVTEISKEDLRKTEIYKSRAEMLKLKAKYADYEEYLKSLEMEAKITDFAPLYTRRIAQLTNKSNQFNLTTYRCSENDINIMQNDSSYVCLCGRLIDKYNDNGIVTAVSGELIDSDLHIRLWVMSCRVLNRKLENLMMNVLIGKARALGVKKVYGYFYPTEKNELVKDFYKMFSYHLVSEDEQGNRIYILDVDSYEKKETQISIT